jgi:hypothetical protein
MTVTIKPKLSAESKREARIHAGVFLDLVMPNKPTDQIPKMPWDIGEVNSDELMALFTRFVEWANYLSVQVAHETAAEEGYEDEIRYLANGYVVKTGKVTVARAELELTDEMKDLRFKLRVQRHKRKLTEALFENCNRSANTCSRELSRRLAASPAQQREARMTP